MYVYNSARDYALGIAGSLFAQRSGNLVTI